MRRVCGRIVTTETVQSYSELFQKNKRYGKTFDNTQKPRVEYAIHNQKLGSSVTTYYYYAIPATFTLPIKCASDEYRTQPNYLAVIT